ncbi:MAG TPA: ATP-binding cassette domain-containing protein [Polyangiaceae bacterium]|nr:ATP-binding cassette domain-containing protein [Polyangiaceae bacterium]
MSHAFSSGGPVLQDIDLVIEAGSFVALLGPSGCGKSTLLRFISGLDRPAAGSISISSVASGADESAATARTKLAFVFQDAQLLPWRSVLDNVALPLELQGLSRAQARERARGPLAEVELSDVHERFPDQLSGGMRMRVSIARALVTEPSVLLLDEPFAALDELTRQRLDERLRRLWQARRMTVIFVTHALAEAAFLAERALVMSRRPGRIVLDHHLQLPHDRPLDLRTESEFVAQTALLYRALQQHGALDEASLPPLGGEA